MYVFITAVPLIKLFAWGEGESEMIAQVVGESMTSMETALHAFLYISPRTTPAGHMLERLYCCINTDARDTELRCLRVLSIFNDTTDIEKGFSDMMSLVMRCFKVKDNFT